MVVIDAVLQYACAVNRKEMPGTDDIVFEGVDEEQEVPAGLLSNLGRAGAGNYLADLTCGLPPRRCLDYNFLTELQDVGVIERARAYVGRPRSCDGRERMENQEDILSRRNETQSCGR